MTKWPWRGRPIIGLVKQLREQVPEGQRHLVHFGTTTQDILDTACSLQMKTGLQWLDAKLAGILAAIDSLAADCRGCQGIARTNGQYAMPIQLTQKFAVWRQELQRRRRALVDVGKTNLWLQLAGPVGDHSGFGAKAEQLRTGMARELGLSLVSPHWQNARDGIAEIIASLGLLAASITKIAHNINLLSSSDIGEYRERQTPGKGNSSTMPHKRNQRCSEFAEATARLARQHAEQINESGLHQHERSGGAWISEWYIVPQVFLLSSAAVMWTERLFTSLEINEQQIAENLARFQQG